MLTIAPPEVPPPLEAFRLQARLIPVRSGLHAISYVSARDSDNPPCVLLQAMPEDAPHISFMSSRDDGAFSLTTPGDVIVIRAVHDARLVATTASLGHLGTGSAVIEIARLGERIPKKARPALATVELLGAIPFPPPSPDPSAGKDRTDRSATPTPGRGGTTVEPARNLAMTAQTAADR